MLEEKHYLLILGLISSLLYVLIVLQGNEISKLVMDPNIPVLTKLSLAAQPGTTI